MCRCVSSAENVHTCPKSYEERHAIGPSRLVLVLRKNNTGRLLAFAHSENRGETHYKGRYAAPEHDHLQSRQPVSEDTNNCRPQRENSKKDKVYLPLLGLIVLIQERDERKNRLSLSL